MASVEYRGEVYTSKTILSKQFFYNSDFTDLLCPAACELLLV